jgi:hypothetical protein
VFDLALLKDVWFVRGLGSQERSFVSVFTHPTIAKNTSVDFVVEKHHLYKSCPQTDVLTMHLFDIGHFLTEGINSSLMRYSGRVFPVTLDTNLI